MPTFAVGYTSNTLASATLTNATETVIATVTAVSVDATTNVVRLYGSASLTVGTDGVTLTLRWRRGTDITGTLVAASPDMAVVAGQKVEFGHNAIDQPPRGVHTYVLTGQAGSASATSALSGVFCDVSVGS